MLEGKHVPEIAPSYSTTEKRGYYSIQKIKVN